MAQNHEGEAGGALPNNDESDAEVSRSSEEATNSASAEVDDLKAKVASAEAKALDFEDRYIRCLADMENLRRRTESEKRDARLYALESAFKDLLPVLDAFDKAFAAGAGLDGDQAMSYHKGIELVHKQLLETLNKHGIKEIETKDAAFNPEYHQAISRIESDEVDSEMVGEEYVRGYSLNDRLLRAAMVQVVVPSNS